MDEFVLWRGKANLKIGMIKISGDMKITNRRILFKTKSKEVEIKMEKIKEASIEGKLVKRLKIETSQNKYSFFIPHAKDVLSLIKNFVKHM